MKLLEASTPQRMAYLATVEQAAPERRFPAVCRPSLLQSKLKMGSNRRAGLAGGVGWGGAPRASLRLVVASRLPSIACRVPAGLRAGRQLPMPLPCPPSLPPSPLLSPEV